MVYLYGKCTWIDQIQMPQVMMPQPASKKQ